MLAVDQRTIVSSIDASLPARLSYRLNGGAEPQ